MSVPFPSRPRPLASIVFGVSDLRCLGAMPNGRGDVWSASVKAVRPKLFCKVFRNVLFVESSDTAYIFGIEVQGGRPFGLRKDMASQQQEFIHFLREQTHIDAVALDWFAEAFQGYKYGCECAATAAYVVARNIPLHLGVGYRAESGFYELIGIHRTDDLVANARLTVPFDELDEL